MDVLLPYHTIDNTVQYMAGLLLISGWLSHATYRSSTYRAFARKKLLRLLPAYFFALPMAMLAFGVLSRFFRGAGPFERFFVVPESFRTGAFSSLWGNRLVQLHHRRI